MQGWEVQEDLREPGNHRESRRLLGIVLLAALVVRVYLVVHTPVITKDAVFYIEQAELMRQGVWWKRQIAAGEFEPVFPLAILSFYSILGDWELAVKVASAAFGVLAVIPFFLVSRDVFNSETAFAAGILYGVHPYFARNSAEGLTETTFLFFLFMVIWLVMKGLNAAGIRWYLVCAVMIVIARLTRLEGIWLFPAVFLFLSWRFLLDLRRREWRASGPLIRFSLAFILIAAPLLILSKEVIGILEFSSFKSFGGITRVAEEIPGVIQESGNRPSIIAYVQDSVRAVWREFIHKTVQVFHPLLLFLAATPLFMRSYRRQFQDYWRLTCSVAVVLSGGVFVVWLVGIAPADRRHFVPAVAVALPWSAVGIEMISMRMTKFVVSKRKILQVVKQLASASGNNWRGILLIVVTLILSAKTIKPQRLDKVPLKDAAAWIVGRQVKNPVIMANDNRIAFYAKGSMLFEQNNLEGKTADEQNTIVWNIVEEAGEKKANFIFLKGSLSTKSHRTIQSSGAVEEITEWRSVHGDVYTLIELKGVK